MKNIDLRKVVELSNHLKVEAAFPKTVLLILAIWKEEDNDVLFDKFLSNNVKYRNLLESMEKDGLLSGFKANRKNDKVIEFISRLYTPESISLPDMLNIYNKLWAGRMGVTGQNYKYTLLDIDKNREALYKFFKEYPNTSIEAISKAVGKYFDTLTKQGDYFKFATKSNTFLEEKIYGYLEADHPLSSYTEVENSFYKDM